MTPDDRVPDLLPALREFVDAVNDRDYDTMQAALQHTPPITLAVLAAGWVGDLQNELDELRGRYEGEQLVAATHRRRLRLQAKSAERQRDEALAAQKAGLRTITRLQGDLYIARQRKEGT